MSIKKGDLYFADLSPVTGSEQGGIRPVLVVQNDVGNKYSPTIIVAAVTSRRNKADLPTHVEIAADGKIYYCKDTGICYVLNEARDGWFTPFLGYDNETIAPDASGLLAVKAVPLSRVTGLQDELKRLEEKINAGGGSNLKPGDEFSVAQDGTFSVKTLDVRKITGLETRLNSLENSLEWGEM